MSKPNNEVKISKDVQKFSELTLKQFKKKNKDSYDGKKELKRAYYQTLIDYLPDTIMWVIKNGHIQTEAVQTTKANIYAKFVSGEESVEFVEAILKELKHDNEIENIKLLPIIIKDILVKVNEENVARAAQNPTMELVNADAVIALNQKILKKKVKNAAEEGISEALAIDVLSTIPCDKALAISTNYRIGAFFNTLYEHAKTETVPFDKIMKEMIDKDAYSAFITFELLEKKERFAKLNDSQKELYVAISAWCFKTMNEMSKDNIEDIIKTYVKRRKDDSAQQKDSNRRYALASLSVEEYEKVAKVISRMIADDQSIKTYLQ